MMMGSALDPEGFELGSSSFGTASPVAEGRVYLELVPVAVETSLAGKANQRIQIQLERSLPGSKLHSVGSPLDQLLALGMHSGHQLYRYCFAGNPSLKAVKT